MPIPPKVTGSDAPATQSLFAGALRAYLNLQTDQAVVANQKWSIPPDKRLYVTVASPGPQKSYGATQAQMDSPDGSALLECVAIATREMISVDIYSRSQEAVNRKEEVLAFLNSTQLQQLCEEYAISVARMPISFVDLSSLEGAAILNRFRLIFAVLRTRTKQTVIQYYDTFQKPALVIEP